jgi:diguanylate cyclase (GGDEF)-like protein
VGEALRLIHVSPAHRPALGDALDAGAFGPFAWHPVESLEAAAEALHEAPAELLLVELHAPDAEAELLRWPLLATAALDTAVLAVQPAPDAALAERLLPLGVQDLLEASALDAPEALARALRLAAGRKRLEREARKAWHTDLGTGLPNHAQLLEHMTHLVALRGREPASMALIVLRLHGLHAVEAGLGAEGPQVLRRKAAVRLRAALRASDVVASIGPETFAVLLAWTEAPEDGERVGAKLARALASPFAIAGQERSLAVSHGIALFPAQGQDAEALLRRALMQAAAAEVVVGGRPGAVTLPLRSGGDEAANDPADTAYALTNPGTPLDPPAAPPAPDER